MTILITLVLATPALSVELFRHCGTANDGGTLEYLFESDQTDVPKTLTKEKVEHFLAKLEVGDPYGRTAMDGLFQRPKA